MPPTRDWLLAALCLAALAVYGFMLGVVIRVVLDPAIHIGV